MAFARSPSYRRGVLAAAALAGAVSHGACGGTASLDFPGAEDGGEAGPASPSVCPRAGEVSCGGKCTPLRTDPANCGGCAVVCGGSTPLCNLGECAASCSVGLTACNGGCVDLARDVHDCGACGAVCAESQSCTGGRCVCPVGAVPCGGACVETAVDASNCGGCGIVCSGATPLCNGGGKCAAACGAGLSACKGSCIDTTSSTKHCGGCNQRCAGDELCSGATCSCPPGQIFCSGICVTVSSSKCGTSCSPPTVACGPTGCVDTSDDTHNCGGCSVKCPSGGTCSAGMCACSAPFSACSGVCVDTRSDPLHCGSCAPCGANLQCRGGRCLP